MDEGNAVGLAHSILPVLFAGEWFRLVLTRRLRGFGIVFGAGAVCFASIYALSVTGPILDPTYQSITFGLLHLERDALSFVIGLVITAGTVLAMEMAARPPKGWTSWLIVLVAIVALATLGGSYTVSLLTSPLSMKITAGTLVIPAPVTIAVLFLLVIVPFVPAIPWALLRSEESSVGLNSVLRRYTLTLGVVVTAVLYFAAVIAGLADTAGLGGAETSAGRGILGFGLVSMGLTCAWAYWQFRNLFLLPALRLLEFVQKPLGERGARPEMPKMWQPAIERLYELELAQQRMRAFLENSPVELAIRDLDGNTLLSSGSEQPLQRVAAAAASDAVGDALSTDDVARVRAIDQHVAATGKPYFEEGALWSGKPGEEGLMVVFPIPDPHGEKSTVGTFYVEKTEMLQTKAELFEMRAVLESFLENAPFPLSLSDTQAEGGMRFVVMNPAARDYYGEAASEALMAGDVSSMESFWPEWNEKVGLLAQQVLHDGQPRTVESSITRHDEERRQVAVSVFPVRDQNDAVRFVGSVVVDLTEFHEAQALLARSRDTAHQSEKLAALGQLIAGVAHELNNPLAVVLGRAELLQERLAGSEHARALDSLSSAADRCARIVKAFLAMARQTGPSHTAADINEQVEIAFDLTIHGLRSAGIEVVRDLDSDLPEVMADDDQIVQVLINLIINAQHALETCPGPARLSVRTYVWQDSKSVAIEVADNGAGVPIEARSRLFEPFFSTKEVGAGTGLGLSVCKGIVEAHGGTIELDTSHAEGALFRVLLPMTADVVAPELESATSVTPRHVQGRVLIVDDEPDVAELLAECLAPLELDCEIAPSAVAALEMLERDSGFVAIFSDARMPGMDGFQLFAEVRRGWPELAGRFVFVSGDVLHRDFVGQAEISGRPVIEKPFSFNIVRDAALAVIAGGEFPS